ncbi:MAG: septal ring lytic transglycosylase RlpA family lipoprotein [Bacteroidetes bacterium]|nr:MAG: septal ring lytic transglycosylase RlpA family lipoprotein [Bacteroidota bacterium]
MQRIIVFIVLGGFLFSGSCSVSKNKKEFAHYEFYQKGEASWYGPGFNGKKTASGEIFDMNKFTAAHRKLPFGTKVKVTNLNNNKSVIVRINDRGPYKKGRIIDLSRKAAIQIGLAKSGIAPVKIEILKKG